MRAKCDCDILTENLSKAMVLIANIAEDQVLPGVERTNKTIHTH